MKKILLFLTCAATPFWISGCTNNTPLTGGANSLQEIKDALANALTNTDEKEFAEFFVTKTEYVTAIHSLLPEKKDDPAMIFNVFIEPQRAAISSRRFKLLKTYTGIWDVKIGEPKRTEKHGNVTMHFELPLTYKYRKDGKVETYNDNHFIGIIVEKKGKFKLLNCFRE